MAVYRHETVGIFVHIQCPHQHRPRSFESGNSRRILGGWGIVGTNFRPGEGGYPSNIVEIFHGKGHPCQHARVVPSGNCLVNSFGIGQSSFGGDGGKAIQCRIATGNLFEALANHGSSPELTLANRPSKVDGIQVFPI
jgi:hypothetical protein